MCALRTNYGAPALRKRQWPSACWPPGWSDRRLSIAPRQLHHFPHQPAAFGIALHHDGKGSFHIAPITQLFTNKFEIIMPKLQESTKGIPATGAHSPWEKKRQVAAPAFLSAINLRYMVSKIKLLGQFFRKPLIALGAHMPFSDKHTNVLIIIICFYIHDFIQ